MWMSIIRPPPRRELPAGPRETTALQPDLLACDDPTSTRSAQPGANREHPTDKGAGLSIDGDFLSSTPGSSKASREGIENANGGIKPVVKRAGMTNPQRPLEGNRMDGATRLLKDGYVVLPKVVPTDLLDELDRRCSTLVALEPNEQRQRFRFHGSLIPIPYWEDAFASLVAHPTILETLGNLRSATPRWISGYVISKPPHSPSLWWHQDWWAWNSRCSALARPPQVFVMVYLTDTTQGNGCLRVIPGSHRHAVARHRDLLPAHSEEINDADEHSVAHSVDRDEVSVPVQRGDVVIGDARLLHATHANCSDRPRTCITLWYAPCYARLPSRIRHKMAAQYQAPPADWISSTAAKILTPVLVQRATMKGSGPYERRPGKHLRGFIA